MLSLKVEEGPKNTLPANMKDRYVLRCINALHRVSGNNNPMYVLTWEMIGYHNPETGVISDTIIRPNEEGVSTEYLIGGASTQTFHAITEKAKGWLIELLDKLQIKKDVQDENGNIDPTNPPTEPFEGICASAICYSEEVVQRKDVTPEQKAENPKAQGEPILGPDGKELKYLRLKVGQFIGRCSPDIEDNIRNNIPMPAF